MDGISKMTIQLRPVCRESASHKALKIAVLVLLIGVAIVFAVIPSAAQSIVDRELGNSPWAFTATDFTFPGDLIVGDITDGELIVEESSLVDVLGNAFIGNRAQSVGSVGVRRGGTWTSNELYVGFRGSGILSIDSGGRVASTYGRIGWQPGSSGEVVVSDHGSLWEMSESLAVGERGAGYLGVLKSGRVSTLGNSYVGINEGASGMLRLSDGGHLSTSGYVSIAHTAHSKGDAVLTGDGTTWDVGTVLYVGRGGEGSLSVIERALVTGSDDGIIGFGPGSQGVINVGSAATLQVQQDFYIGFEGAGTLNVSTGGQVFSDFGRIGWEPGSQGFVLVSDEGSTWSINETLSVGERGAGSLSVSSKGQVTSGLNTYVGVGDGSSGKLSLESGGSLITNGFASIGHTPGSSGVATVAGSGSAWDVNGELSVGRAGSGLLAITDHASVVTGGHGYVGFAPEATGSLSVGSSGRWITKDLYVGFEGAGELWISGGGSVESSLGRIGWQPDAKGQVVVSDEGSVWTMGGSLAVGERGNAGLTVASQGRVQTGANNYVGIKAGSKGVITIESGGLIDVNGFASVGHEAGSEGEVSISGEDSVWSMGDVLHVGRQGRGSLLVSHGGTVNTGGDGIIANMDGSRGAVSVSGEGSLWTVQGKVYVGHMGDGALRITDQASVESPNDAIIGYHPNAYGTALVSTEGLWRSKDLYVGYDGTGVLTVSNGGQIRSGLGRIAWRNGSRGAVLVTDEGSTWEMTGTMAIGERGDGSLTVASEATATTQGNSYIAINADSSGALRLESGGSLNSEGFASVAHGAGSKGRVEIDGKGSVWNVGGDLNIGRMGTGEMTVANGGTVRVGAGSKFNVGLEASANGVLNVGAAPTSVAQGAGVVDTPTIDLGKGSATVNFNHTDTDYMFSTRLVSSGNGLHRINVYAGRTTLTGNSDQFSGDTTVYGGVLQVNGTLGGAIRVEPGGVLGGTGSIGSTTVAVGGVHAPGASIGTQTVQGDYTNDGTLEIELDSGQADQIVIHGNIDVSNTTLEIVLRPADTDTTFDGPFTIIKNAGAEPVVGTFAAVRNVERLAFLDHEIRYDHGDDGDVTFELMRNNATAADLSETSNQLAVGELIDTLPETHPLWKYLVVLDVDDVPGALDQLSGQIHASVKSVLLEEGALIWETLTERFTSGVVGGSPNHANLADQDAESAPVPSKGAALWSRLLSTGATTRADDHSPGMAHQTIGAVVGGETEYRNWRWGMVAGKTGSRADLGAGQSVGQSDSNHLGLYAGGQWANFAAHLAATYASSDIRTTRQVSFKHFDQTQRADYWAGRTQVSGEIRRPFRMTSLVVEPFTTWVYTKLATSGFAEEGEVAALDSLHSEANARSATLGVRVSTGTRTKGRGMVAWHREIDGQIAQADLAFPGTDTFHVSANPIVRDVALVEAGLDIGVSPDVSVSIFYAGRFAENLNQQRVGFSVGRTF